MPSSIEQKLLGLTKEAVRGVAETTVTRFIAPEKGAEFEFKPNLIQDEAVRGMFDRMPPTMGTKAGTAKLSMDVEAENMGELIYATLGSVTTTEQASFIIGATNGKIDFNIGGDALAATVAQGTYPAGTSEAVADSLCKAIYDAIVAVEATGTYHVTFSNTTKKFTITKTAGTFQILWNTGANKANSIRATLGFADTDDTGSLSYVSDNVVVPVYKHSFKRGTGIQMPSYSMFMDRGLSKKVYNLCCAKSLKLSGSMDGKLKADVDLMFKSEGDGTAVTMTPTWEDPVPFMFFQTDVKLGGVSDVNIESWNLEIDNQSVEQRTLNQSQEVKDILAVGRLLVKGGYEVYFENETERAKFLANTQQSLQVVLTGGLIKTGSNFKLDIQLARIHYDAFPFGEKNGLLGAVVAFNGYYKVGGSPADSLIIDLYNRVASY